MYSPGQVALATLLGSPVAGAWLIKRNFRRLGRPGASWLWLAVGVVWTALLYVLGELAPVRTIAALGSIAGMAALTRALQGDAFYRHERAGARKGSWGFVVVTAIVTVAIVFAIAVAAAVGHVLLTAAPTVTTKGVTVGYRGDVTAEQATEVATYLSEPWPQGYIELDGDAHRVTAKMIIRPVELTDRDKVDAFRDFAVELSTQTLKGVAVDLDLFDEDENSLRKLRWEDRPLRIEVDGDVIVARDAITEAQARSVAQALRDRDVFKGGGNEALIRNRRRPELLLNYADLSKLSHEMFGRRVLHREGGVWRWCRSPDQR